MLITHVLYFLQLVVITISVLKVGTYQVNVNYRM